VHLCERFPYTISTAPLAHCSSSRVDGIAKKCRLFYLVHFENDDANGETRVCQLCPDLRLPIKSASTSHDCTPRDRIASLQRTDIVHALPCSGYIARHGREQQQSPTPGATANRHRRRPGEEAAFPRAVPQTRTRSPSRSDNSCADSNRCSSAFSYTGAVRSSCRDMSDHATASWPSCQWRTSSDPSTGINATTEFAVLHYASTVYPALRSCRC
jgi:hypothetical protein